jgi:sterol desaturase/sphingolipid hydroxylase (fatty acid hydroxylase superfamily)
MHDWQQSHGSYYADFMVTPVIVLTLALLSIPFGSDRPALIAAFVAGLVLWTFVEYWTHRALFHHVFRRAHDLHHIRPRGFDAAPWWMTMAIQAGLGVASIGVLGWSIGAGAFLGLEVGYFAYIAVHDRIHHGRKARSGHMARLARAHAIHHRGVEANFGVVTTAWDRVFGTYDPR